MNEIINLFLTLGAGFLLGTFFFVGLWWTTKKGIVSKSPALWFIVSLLVRLTVTMLGFYFVCRNHWERMLVCLLGFIIARTIITKFTQISEAEQNVEEVDYDD
jgi:F1F0 ATPase subunit 2